MLPFYKCLSQLNIYFSLVKKRRNTATTVQYRGVQSDEIAALTDSQKQTTILAH